MRANNQLRLALGALAATLLLGCGASAHELDPTVSTATATPTEAVATPSSVSSAAMAPTLAPAADAKRVETIEVAVLGFADALVSGDLTALTRAFSPTGLRQAAAMRSARDTEGTGGVTDAVVEALTQVAAPVETWRADLRVTAPAGTSTLVTWWQVFEDGRWRVISLESRP